MGQIVAADTRGSEMKVRRTRQVHHPTLWEAPAIMKQISTTEKAVVCVFHPQQTHSEQALAALFKLTSSVCHHSILQCCRSETQPKIPINQQTTADAALNQIKLKRLV